MELLYAMGAPGASRLESVTAATAVPVCLLRAALCSPTKIGPRGIGTKWGEVEMSECPCIQGRLPGTTLGRPTWEPGSP